MKKEYAIKLLGGTIHSAAESVGISYQAVKKWPDALSPAVADRVIAAVARNDPVSWPKNCAQINESLKTDMKDRKTTLTKQEG